MVLIEQKEPAPTKEPQRRSGLGPLMRRIHFYAGMFIGPFLLVAAISGALYAIAPTMEAIAYRDMLRVPESSTSVPLSQQVSAAQAEHPDMPVAQIWPSSEPGETTRVLLSDESVGEDRLRSVFVDPGTGDIVGDAPTYSGLGELPMRFWISQLHKDLHLGDPGALYSELAASWMWFIAFGGLYLWLKRTRSAKKAVLGLGSGGKGTRKRIMNLHAVAGVWLLIAMVGLSATGITWSNVAGQNVSTTVKALKWKANPINKSLTEDGSKAEGSKATGTDSSAGFKTEPRAVTPKEAANQAATVLATARAEGLTGSVRMFPGEDVNTAWQVSERWVPYRTSSDAITVNGSNGKVVDRLPFSELPLFSKLTSWGIYLHMGIMFGLPLQILLFLVALAIAGLVVTGYMMWWKRRPTLGGVAGVPGPNTGLSATDWLIILAFIGIVGTFLPLFGASLIAMLLADRALAKRARQRTFTVDSQEPAPKLTRTTTSDSGAS